LSGRALTIHRIQSFFWDRMPPERDTEMRLHVRRPRVLRLAPAIAIHNQNRGCWCRMMVTPSVDGALQRFGRRGYPRQAGAASPRGTVWRSVGWTARARAFLPEIAHRPPSALRLLPRSLVGRVCGGPEPLAGPGNWDRRTGARLLHAGVL
jgi:hypothetical protein